MRHFAGLPLGRWMFALRIWLAINLALGVAFWVQLSGASSAGVAAAILALQTRGQIIEKAIYFILGTILGGIMSVVIVGLFAQVRDLYVIAYSAWLAVCVFIAGFLDGNRAYGAVICGYTISIVAILHIDDPSSLFSEVVNRCAAVTLGIISVTLIVDLLGGPDIGPGLISRIGRGCRKVRDFTEDLTREGSKPDTTQRTADLLRVASDQHQVLNAVPVEAISGTARAGAVRATLAALVGEVRAARCIAIAAGMRSHADPRLGRLVQQRLEAELSTRRDDAETSYSAARAGRAVAHPPRMPIYRPWQGALRNALRAFSAVVISGYLFIVLGWSSAATSWAFVGIVMCLSSNAPDPGVMTKAALIAFPSAVVLGGITEFAILSGADAFPLLMIGTAPTLLMTLLLTSSPKPSLASVGLLTTVFTIVVIEPSNPQSYDPQNYVILGLFLIIAAITVFVLARVLFPTTDSHRRRWALSAARSDMWAALRGRGRPRPEPEAHLLAASRIGTLSGLREVATLDRDVASALRMDDLTRVVRRIRRGLGSAGGHRLDVGLAREADVALASADAERLRRLARTLIDRASDALVPLASDMAWAADLIDAPADLRTARAHP